MRFCLVSSFGSYSSVSSFCQIPCAYFYVLSRSVMFPSLGELVLCKRHCMGPGRTLLSGHQGHVLWGCPLCGSSWWDRADYCGHPGRRVWSLALLAPHPCLVWWPPVVVDPPTTKRLEGRLKNGTCQHHCPHGRMSFPNGSRQCLFPQEASLAFCLSARLSKISKVVLPGHITASALALVKFCMCPLSMECLFLASL